MENSQQQQQQQEEDNSVAEYGWNIDSKWPATRNFLLSACNYIIGAEIRQKNTEFELKPPSLRALFPDLTHLLPQNSRKHSPQVNG